ncbi:BREX system P-loop protein BrxC [Candidatus Poriferisodalis sp.]|uniref:BREX system P-loop protein BrxC n=1 Tax=Candidatus Poriferisodalis sp. TaxID=3101277 RepID=UPI003B0140D7
MNIGQLFSREIDRDIKEVIKVDDHDAVLDEVEEYVLTSHIASQMVGALESFQSTINSPSEEINIWISGFFGSGKSSFAKILGYLLANPQIDGKPVANRFFELHEVPPAKALLNTIYAAAPTETVLLDLNTSPNVLEEGEPVVLPIYRTLLQALGYSRDPVLAELEFELEGRNDYIGFSVKYEEVFATEWVDQRDFITAKNRASRVLHELDDATFPAADSWSNAASLPAVTAKWFANRALELLRRRRPGKERLVLVVDEVGQYVSRSTDRMRHLQGLAEECQKTKGRLWLVATSQEKLTDVVDSLEGKQTELAKAQDRFPVRVDLLPSDIDEVTGKRVLNKTAAGAARVRELLDVDRNKLVTSVSPQSDRHGPFADEDFVRLYPLVPYQLHVLIDAVSARRAEGGAPQTMGGSNRTLIRHAQQLISNQSVGLAPMPVGALVTLDRSYMLLEDVIPTAWRHEVDQVAAKHGDESLEVKIMRVVALCADVPGLALTTRNLAVALHPSISGDPIEDAISVALDNLVAEDRVRETDDGYRLQSPEQKDWENTRRGIEMKPGDAVRLRRHILEDALGTLTVTKRRSFKIELFAEREKVSDGDITLDVRDQTSIEDIRQTSRLEDAKNRIFWSFSTEDDTWEALAECYRSNQMIDRYDNVGQSDVQRVLLAEERKRRDRVLRTAEQLVARDATNGTTIFRGVSSEAPSGELRAAAGRLISGLLDDIYPSIRTFAGSIRRAEVLQVLEADSLDGFADQLGPEGLGLFKLTATGRQMVTDGGPVAAVVTHIQARNQYGEDQNGAQIERFFGAPPFGAPVESVQAALAAAMRAGLIEVVSQAARITSFTDQRLGQVFGSITKFRAASFKPAEESGPSTEVRGAVSEWLGGITGEVLSLDLHELADAGRNSFADYRQPCTEARSTLAGAGLTVPQSLVDMDELLARVTSADDELVVTTLFERQADLDAGRDSISELAAVVDDQLGTLRAAKSAREIAILLADGAGSTWATELGELLDRAQYSDDLAQLRSLTASVELAAEQERIEFRARVTSQVEDALENLRSRYPRVDDSAFEDATEPLRGLTTSNDLSLLRASADAVPGIVLRVAELLDALSTTKEVRHIRVSDVWGGPITSLDDVDTALERLREALLAQLDDNTEVRLR